MAQWALAPTWTYHRKNLCANKKHKKRKKEKVCKEDDFPTKNIFTDTRLYTRGSFMKKLHLEF